MGGGGGGGNKWKFIQKTILKRFWQKNNEKLPNKLYSSLKIPTF